MLENEDFRRVFMAMPMPSLLLRADSPVFTIIDVNEAYLQATGSSATDLLHKGVFEAFPDNPDLEDANGVSNLRTSLDLVVCTGSAHKMPVQRFDIPIRGGNEFVLKYCLTHNVPVLDHEGKTYFIIHSVIDVTAEIENRDKNEIAERDLNKAKDLLLQAEDITQIGSWELDLSNNELYWSEGVFRICGYEPGEMQINFATGLSIIHPDDQEMALQAMQHTIEHGDTYEIIKRFIRKDGSIRIINSRAKIILNERGEKVKLAGVFQDITERKKTQQALEDAYQEKHMILESIGDGFFAVDKEWKVHYWNQSAERILGLSRTEVLGKHIYSIYPEQQYATFYTNCVIAERDQVTMHFEEYVEPLGIWIDVSVYPSPSGLLVYFRDVTERKEIQKQFESVVNNMPGITYRCLLDDKWSMLFISNGVEAITGYPAADFVINKTRTFSSIIHPDDLNATFIIAEPLSKGEVFSIQYRIICADGDIKWVEDKGRGVYNNSHQLIYIDGVIMDITEQKQYQETLLRLNEELNKRAQDLAISNAELEQFAYVASHDLQEPLRMITGFLSQLEKKYKHELDDTARRYIGFATDGAKRMRTVILDLLEYSRVGSVDYEKEPVNIHQVIAEILEMNRNDLIRREARVFFDGMPLIRAARTPISQLFQNLITNALKYQSPDQRPEIKITATEYPSYWQFAVADNGIGIEKEYFEKIFVIFQRLHHRNEYSGTGIGLSICKKIVDMHNGKIWVESLRGRGSTFFFTIEK